MRYLLITFFKKPTGQIDEQISISKRVKPTDLSTCNVIIDFKDKKIEKAVVNGSTLETTFDKMVDYYKNIYPDLINQLIKNN